ncbi:MAG: hypothetical protein BWX73_02075 [Lentisphaerae bacterium ADurb.Bin082]|nr:MAG: hypothetical protein BWX73_02075 [Lentisphaerae bacterium ADurb.Bin082]
MSDECPAPSGGVVLPGSAGLFGCACSGTKSHPSLAAGAFGVSASSVPPVSEGVMSAWRLAVLSIALGLGLAMSAFWLLRRFPLPFYGYGQVLPVVLGLLAVMPPARSSAGWLRLRCATLMVAGLAPFLTWHLLSDGNFYFRICVLLLLAAVVWHWLETLQVVRLAAVAGGHAKLARAASRSLSIIVYGVIIPLCAGHGAFFLLVLNAGTGAAFDFGLLWNTQPKIIGDALRVLVFWGGCHVVANCLAAAILSSRPGAGVRRDVVTDGQSYGVGDI